jgi:hypothetical protein
MKVLAKWFRNLLASSLYREIRECAQCEFVGGLADYALCEKHQNHVLVHNTLTSING